MHLVVGSITLVGVISDAQVQISAAWQTRLASAFRGILLPSSNGWRSEDRRTVVEVSEAHGHLMGGRIVIVLPDDEENDLAALKLSCWTMLFLKALFPAWRGVEQWVERAVDQATDTWEPVHHRLGSHRVQCEYSPKRQTVTISVKRLNESSFPE